MNTNLINREIIGFLFEDKEHDGIHFPSDMFKLIGRVGTIKEITATSVKVAFGYDEYYYPIKLVRDNLKNKEIKHGDILIQRISDSIWVAKTETFERMKAEVEVKGTSEYYAFVNMMNFIECGQMPNSIQTLENGDKLYTFKK